MRRAQLKGIALYTAMVLTPATCALADGGSDSIPSVSLHSLTIIGGGGLHSLNTSFDGVDYEGMRPGGFLGVEYDFGLNRLLDIGTGVHVSSYAAKSETTDKIVTPDAVDLDGETYTRTLTLSQVSERQRAAFIELPIRLTLRYPVSRTLTFLASAQAHASILLKDRYKVTGGQISTAGYYPQYDLTLDGDAPGNGFYTLTPSYSGTIGLRRAGIGVGGRIGLRREVSPSVGICFGVYGKYSITDVAPSTRGTQFDPDSRQTGSGEARYNGAMVSQACQSAHPLSVGVSVGLRLSFKKKARASAAPAPEAHLRMTGDAASAKATISAEELNKWRATMATDSIARRVDTDIQRLIDDAGGIRFDMGSGALLGESAEVVAHIAEILNSHPDFNITVTGHTCDVGTRDTNLRIGMERAEAVSRCLEENGVDESRIRTLSAGDTQPIAPNDTEEHRTINRRVKITVAR